MTQKITVVVVTADSVIVSKTTMTDSTVVGMTVMTETMTADSKDVVITITSETVTEGSADVNQTTFANSTSILPPLGEAVFTNEVRYFP